MEKEISTNGDDYNLNLYCLYGGSVVRVSKGEGCNYIKILVNQYTS